MSNPIWLAVNRQTKGLVSWLGSTTQIPDLFQSNSQDWRIQVVDPDPTRIGSYTAVDLNGTGLRMALGPTPTGTAGGPSLLALADASAWTWDAANKWFTGSIALNTTDIDAYIGGLAFKTAYLELNLTQGAGRSTIYQNGNVNLKAVLDELTSVSPNPTNQYLTAAECFAIFARLKGLAGQRIVLVSPNGSYGLELGANDDGTEDASIIPNP